MSDWIPYPAPTRPLHPERSQPQPSQPRPRRTANNDVFTSWPPPTTGKGIPVKFAPIANVVMTAGETFQLIPALLDIEDSLQVPTERLRYLSDNPKILVSDSGLIVTNVPASRYSRRGSAETATLQIHHGTINTFVSVMVKTDPLDFVSE